jgi:hypothetical protein
MAKNNLLRLERLVRTEIKQREFCKKAIARCELLTKAHEGTVGKIKKLLNEVNEEEKQELYEHLNKMILESK